jgi:C_GCAxxG_C_C family probable redox protein
VRGHAASLCHASDGVASFTHIFNVHLGVRSKSNLLRMAEHGVYFAHGDWVCALYWRSSSQKIKRFLVMDRLKRVLQLFYDKYNCAQSVFAACAEDEGLNEAERLALASAFGGGVAGQGEICGALTGALMALGEARRKEIAADPVSARKAVYEQARQITNAFRAVHGSILCRELTGCALDTEEGHRNFQERDVRKTVCSKLVVFAVNQVSEATDTPQA